MTRRNGLSPNSTAIFGRKRFLVTIGPVLALPVAALIPGVTLRNSPVLEEFLLGEFLSKLLLVLFLVVGSVFVMRKAHGGKDHAAKRYFVIALSVVLSAILLAQTVRAGLALLSPVQDSRGTILKAERQRSSKGSGALLWEIRLTNGELLRVRTLREPLYYRQSSDRCAVVRHTAYTDFAQILPCGTTP